MSEVKNTLLLLLSNKKNEDILLEFLENRYNIFTKNGNENIINSVNFDIVVIDSVLHQQYKEEIINIKQKSHPIFLPVLLLTTRKNIGVSTSFLWKSIDELIVVPINKVELLARLSILERARKQSIELFELCNKINNITKEKLNLALKAGKIGIWEWDFNSNTVYLSTEWKEILGFKDDELKSNFIEFISRIHPDDVGNFLSYIELCKIKKKEDFLIEFRVRKKDGNFCVIMSQGMFFYDNNKNLEKLLTVNIDITNHIEREKELLMAKDKAEESNRLKTAFLQNISHEIRTPLNAIIGFSDLLITQGSLGEKEKQFAQIICNAGNQLLSIINDIINIATIQAGQVKINEKITNINKLLENIYNQFKIKATAKNLEFDIYSYLSDEEVNIVVDDVKLSQIISNLLNNAIKFTDKGYVRIICNREKDNIKFCIEDSGIGIEKSKHKIIFDMFRQVEIESNKTYGGLGLGLSICKSYVELMGGKIWIESELGKGSKFYFTIPFKVHLYKEKKDYKKDFNLFLKDKKTILIAEDEDYNYAYFEESLSELNLNILRAENGLQAIEICKQNPLISLIIMDIRMPLLDGFEASKRIREFMKDVPIILQTAYIYSYSKDMVEEIGVNDFLTKPINKDILIEKVIKYLY